MILQSFFSSDKLQSKKRTAAAKKTPQKQNNVVVLLPSGTESVYLNITFLLVWIKEPITNKSCVVTAILFSECFQKVCCLTSFFGRCQFGQWVAMCWWMLMLHTAAWNSCAATWRPILQRFLHVAPVNWEILVTVWWKSASPAVTPCLTDGGENRTSCLRLRCR